MSTAAGPVPAAKARDARRTGSKRGSERAGSLVVHGLLIVFAVLAIAPILLIVVNSFKTTPAIFEHPFALPNSDTFSMGGYERVFQRGHFTANYRNSLIVTVSSTVLTLVLATLAAFALTEYRVRFAPLIGGFFVAGIMLPIRLGTVPILRTMISWGLMDTLTALVLVYTAMSLPLAVALLMTYFRSVPHDVKEAARLDGAGELRTLSIVLPMVRPGLAAVASVTMLPIWNDLWFPLILAPSEENQTVTLGVQQFVGQFLNDYPALLGALTLGAVPLVVLFVVFSRQFIQGLSQGIGK